MNRRTQSNLWKVLISDKSWKLRIYVSDFVVLSNRRFEGGQKISNTIESEVMREDEGLLSSFLKAVLLVLKLDQDPRNLFVSSPAGDEKRRIVCMLWVYLSTKLDQRSDDPSRRIFACQHERCVAFVVSDLRREGVSRKEVDEVLMIVDTCHHQSRSSIDVLLQG